MTPSQIAKILGRRGGLQRAKHLSNQRRKEIAQLGAQARIESLRLTKTIQTNFDYVAAIHQLSPPKPVTSESTINSKLPGIYER